MATESVGSKPSRKPKKRLPAKRKSAGKSAPVGGDRDAKIWFVSKGEKTVGPLRPSKIRAFLEKGKLSRTAKVRREGEEAWLPLGEHPAFRGGAGEEDDRSASEAVEASPAVREPSRGKQPAPGSGESCDDLDEWTAEDEAANPSPPKRKPRRAKRGAGAQAAAGPVKVSFFGKIKNWLGIGGVKIKLDVPGQVDKDAGLICGTVVVTTKSPQHVSEIELKLVETYTTGRGDEKSFKEFDLGEITLDDPFDIAPGDTKVIEFELPFAMLKSSNDQLAEKGGLLGGLGKLGKLASAETSTYKVEVSGDVKGVALGPSDSKDIKLV